MKTRMLPVVMMLAFVAPLAAAAESGLKGWGPRLGLASDPDQFIGGFHLEFGEVAKNLRVVPNFQIGLGDDVTVLEATAPLHYLFKQANASFTPYAGGGLAVAWFDRDEDFNNGHGDDSDVELGLKLTGGLEWTLSGKSRFLVELNLGLGDLHDFQVVAGWTF